DPRPQRLARELESRLAVLESPPGAAPRVVIGGDDAGRAAAFGLEREEPVPRADVQHRSALERRGKVEPRQTQRRVVDALRDDAMAEVDRVIPARRVRARAESVGIAHRPHDSRMTPHSIRRRRWCRPYNAPHQWLWLQAPGSACTTLSP